MSRLFLMDSAPPEDGERRVTPIGGTQIFGDGRWHDRESAAGQRFWSLGVRGRFTRERLAGIKPSVVRHLIKPFVPRQGVCVIAGPSTTLKTFLAIEMGLRVSRGEPFHGHRVQQAGVVYVSSEDPEGVRLRLAAWCQRNGRHGKFELIPGLRTCAIAKVSPS